ncbi:uncharacterized protein si:dkey-27h10.2 [Heterodontus francisci]|uniref:uncharacterized protein si:dkey-27h10.2 n=1 Tax=Heterodontus francisci TaxID=7792 RepID=UPI00355B52BE
MAYLAIFYKLLIVNGILAVVTDNETAITIQTSSVEPLNPASTPDHETNFSTISSSGETLNTTFDPEIASSANSSDNHTVVTTRLYSTTGGWPGDIHITNQEEKVNNSAIPDDSSSASTIGLSISTKVPTSQRSDKQASTAITTTLLNYTAASGSKVSRTQEQYTFSTLHTSVSIQKAGIALGGVTIFCIVITILILILILLICYLRRRRHRYSFDLFHKTAEDADIPLSNPIIPGGFEAIPDKEDSNDVKKVNEDMANCDKTSVVNMNLSKEINEKQNNCEAETNHSPAKLSQEITDNLDDWNYKPPGSTFTEIDLMDCVTAE